MNFSLSEEQTLLQDSIKKYITANYSLAERHAGARSELGYDDAHWQNFAEFGWLSLPFPETVGGYGGNIEDTALLFEAFGRGLVLEPYLATVMLAGQIIARSDNTAACGAIIDGKLQCALAGLERQSRQNYRDVRTTATSTSTGFLLHGSKALVMNGASAQTLVVTARTSGAQFDQAGISLFVVDAAAAGIKKTCIRLMDSTLVANIDFAQVAIPETALVGGLDEGWSLLEPVIQAARIAVCAEAVGIIDTLCAKTVEYCKTRTQFGVAISSFQALQHRMVDMLMAAQQSRSILYRAICEYQQGDDSAPATLSAMKALIGKHGRHVGDEAIQLHGGMGMTDELDIGHYVKRLMLLNQLFGDAESSLRAFCEQTYPAQRPPSPAGSMA